MFLVKTPADTNAVIAGSVPNQVPTTYGIRRTWVCVQGEVVREGEEERERERERESEKEREREKEGEKERERERG